MAPPARCASNIHITKLSLARACPFRMILIYAILKRQFAIHAYGMAVVRCYLGIFRVARPNREALLRRKSSSTRWQARLAKFELWDLQASANPDHNPKLDTLLPFLVICLSERDLSLSNQTMAGSGAAFQLTLLSIPPSRPRQLPSLPPRDQGS